jgi:hypothetical protein
MEQGMFKLEHLSSKIEYSKENKVNFDLLQITVLLFLF